MLLTLHPGRPGSLLFVPRSSRESIPSGAFPVLPRGLSVLLVF